MLRKTFDTNSNKSGDILVLGSMVEQAVLDSVEALKKRDLKAAQEIIMADRRINEKRFEIEGQVMTLIATQQPMAHDLRLLASLLDVASELERMGDYAKGIGVINLRMGDEPLLKPLVDIPRMAQKGVDMLHRALTAFVNEDAQAAATIPREDDQVDELYIQVYRELITYIMADPSTIERANFLLGCHKRRLSTV
jgi:phosphate transport system protein